MNNSEKKQEEIPSIENLKITTTLNVQAQEFVPLTKSVKSLLQGLNLSNRKEVKKELLGKKPEEIAYGIYERGIAYEEFLYDLVELYKELLETIKDTSLSSSFLSNIQEDFKNRKDISPKRVLGNAKFIRTLYKKKLYPNEEFITNIKKLSYDQSDLIYFEILKDYIPKEFTLKKYIATYDLDEKSYQILLNNLKGYMSKDTVKEIAKEIYKRATKDENATVDMTYICNDLFPDKKNDLYKPFKEQLFDLAKGEYSNRKVKDHQMSINNVIFIGELFNREILAENIIKAIIDELIGYDPIETELLYNFLYSVGATFDEKKELKEYMDKTFEKLVKIMDNDDVPPQTKSMIENILYLRSNNWQELEEEDDDEEEEEEDFDIEEEEEEEEGGEGTDYEKYRSEYEEYKKSLGK